MGFFVRFREIWDDSGVKHPKSNGIVREISMGFLWDFNGFHEMSMGFFGVQWELIGLHGI